jgi:hypothetical protein
MNPVPVAMSSSIHSIQYVSKSDLALSLSMAWNSFVQSVSKLVRMCIGAGWVVLKELGAIIDMIVHHDTPGGCGRQGDPIRQGVAARRPIVADAILTCHGCAE